MDNKYIYVCIIVYSGIHTFVAADEYCLRDKFEAACQGGEVIIMKNATYGRMRIGECIQYGDIGCSVNVLDAVDRWCSGKQSCAFDVFNDEFDLVEPCGRGLTSYLEASYRCLTVSTDLICTISSEQTGTTYFAGSNTKCRSSTSPLKIKTAPGRRVKLRLYDFTTSSKGTLSCVPLGYISEEVVRSNKTICGGSGNRDTVVYQAVSSELEIRYPTHKQHDGDFLLGVSFMGCADLTISGNTWYKRDGDRIEVGCKDEEIVWTLECINDKWIGDYKNCSNTGSVVSLADIDKHVDNRLSTLPKNTIIVIIISVSVLISATVLVLGAVYTIKKRHQKQQAYDARTLPLTKDAIYTHNKKYGHNYGQSQMPSYHGTTYKPVQHANTCKRNASFGQHTANTIGRHPIQPPDVNGSMRSEAASWNYNNPKYVDGSPEGIEYETPYESRAPESHTYFPLETNSKPPSANEI